MFHFNVLVVSWKGKIVTRKALHPRNDCRHWIVPAGSFLTVCVRARVCESVCVYIVIVCVRASVSVCVYIVWVRVCVYIVSVCVSLCVCIYCLSACMCVWVCVYIVWVRVCESVSVYSDEVMKNVALATSWNKFVFVSYFISDAVIQNKEN